MYLTAAARQAQFFSLEGSETCAHVAQTNLRILNLEQGVKLVTGPFYKTLGPVLQELKEVDLVFLDGHHKAAAVLQYFEQIQSFLHQHSVLVIDDIYWSVEMNQAWEEIQQHPSVTLTVDCFDLGFVFFNPDFKSKQHYCLVPTKWKPWQQWI